MTRVTICIGFSKDMDAQTELAAALLGQFITAGSQVDTIADGIGFILGANIPPSSLDTLKQQASQQNLILAARP